MDDADAGFTTVLTVEVVGIMFALQLMVETVLGLLLVVAIAGSRDIMEAAARAKSSSMVTDTVHTSGIGKAVVADFFIRFALTANGIALDMVVSVKGAVEEVCAAAAFRAVTFALSSACCCLLMRFL